MPSEDSFPKKVTIFMTISSLEINSHDLTRTEVTRDFQARTWYEVHEIENELFEFLDRLQRFYTPRDYSEDGEKDDS